MVELTDFSELFAPQFFYPVVAVVACVLTVYVCGFKRVAEPNFKFENHDEKKRRQWKSKKVKLQPTNGHLPVVEKRIPAPSVIMTEKLKAAAPLKTKDVKVKKKSVPLENSKAKARAPQEVETEGWTKQTNKKGKKNKKSDSTTKIEDLVQAAITEVAITAPVSAPAASEVPTHSVTKTETAIAKTEPSERKTIAEPECAVVPEGKVAVEKKKAKSNISAAVATVKPDLKSEQAVSSKKKKKKKASKESSPTGSTSSQEVAEVATLTAAASNSSGGAGDAPVTADSRLHDDASRSSVNETSDTLATDAPKARKKQVQTNKVFEDNVQSAKDGDAVKPAVSVETSIVMQIADAMRESPEPSLKSPKSPKVSKKSANKKKSKPSNISDTESNNQSETSQTQMDVVSLDTEPTRGAVTEILPQAAEAVDLKPVAESKDGDNAQPQPQQPPTAESQPIKEVAADWHDAKPVKKRKKPRRD